MILQQKNSTKRFDQHFFHPNCFRGNDFATKKFRIKNFSTKFFLKFKVSEEMSLQQKKFRQKIF